jgi:carbamoyltransferase
LGKDPKHPYLEKWFQIAESNDQERYNLAAGLQAATESLIRTVLKYAIQASGLKDMNICLVGGVTLNSVAMGKIKKWFPTMIKDIYIPPVPYDAGLSIGAAQIVHHSILGNPRKQWDNNFTSYMGELWPESAIDTAINKALTDTNNKIFSVEDCDDEKAINLLVNQKIVAIFNKESESGRRALGNRSILADPRSDKMKDNINKKVKHRQWFRPFAPSVLEEHAENWFENFIKSPYMQFVIPFKDDKKQKVPAVVHFDGTARLQTVTKEHNPWYYKFLSEWYKKTNVPMLLNTSFNDREPICENPSHAINCFLGTDIDCLYFPEFSKILLKEQK